MGLEPTSRSLRPAARFQDGSLIRPVGFRRVVLSRVEFRGLESNQRPPRSERGVTTNSNYPGAIVVFRTTVLMRKFGEMESNHHCLVQSQAAYR